MKYVSGIRESAFDLVGSSGLTQLEKSVFYAEIGKHLTCGFLKTGFRCIKDFQR